MTFAHGPQQEGVVSGCVAFFAHQRMGGCRPECIVQNGLFWGAAYEGKEVKRA
ncbi:hypothetical protein C8D90_102384 [Enterobacillus tribolii]|uniref:Uncharacterized protein n=1 Tax=Enterobacillus tribolii TaxID=1487935 RepID=A0A370R1U9_9GAMM|nr:hypothetical protein C8D90_102384 [Enterobacillus tribolii]